MKKYLTQSIICESERILTIHGDLLTTILIIKIRNILDKVEKLQQNITNASNFQKQNNLNNMKSKWK